jgi:hypothetical protein
MAGTRIEEAFGTAVEHQPQERGTDTALTA